MEKNSDDFVFPALYIFIGIFFFVFIISKNATSYLNSLDNLITPDFDQHTQTQNYVDNISFPIPVPEDHPTFDGHSINQPTPVPSTNTYDRDVSTDEPATMAVPDTNHDMKVPDSQNTYTDPTLGQPVPAMPAPHITSLSTTSGGPSTSFIIYGTNLNYTKDMSKTDFSNGQYGIWISNKNYSIQLSAGITDDQINSTVPTLICQGSVGSICNSVVPIIPGKYKIFIRGPHDLDSNSVDFTVTSDTTTTSHANGSY